jgi:hypothetical protein
MESATYLLSTTLRPSAAESARALDETRRLFVRTLAGWASDLLTLRRNGADRASWTLTGGNGDSWSRAA